MRNSPLLLTLSFVFALGGCGGGTRQAKTAETTTTSAEGCAGSSSVRAELAALREAQAATDHLATFEHRQRVALAQAELRKREGGGSGIAKKLASLEDETKKRLVAVERYASAVSESRLGAERSLGEIRLACVIQNFAKKGKKGPSPALRASCEQFAQIAGGVRWSDPRSITSLADSLDQLTLPPAAAEAARAVSAHARKLAAGLRKSTDDIAVLDEGREKAIAEITALEESLSKCTDKPAVHGAEIVVAKEPNARALTVMVRAKPPGDLSEQFERVAELTEEEQMAQFYRAVAVGRFGSGFAIVLDEKGERRTFVVTNRHVVDLATHISIGLEDGSTLPVASAYVDDTYDLAVLVPRDTAHKLAPAGGFDIAARNARDGEEVLATGYPGLLGTPSFQMTRGHVSNERLVFPDGNSLPHVQHTASIDPGSSGGPLLRSGRDVLGVNTFKLIGRDGVAIAVPGSAVARAIDASRVTMSCTGACRARAAEDACIAIASELSDPSPDLFRLERLLGPDLVAAHGIHSHNLIARDDPALFTRFKSSPVATLEEAVARRLMVEAASLGGIHPLETCRNVRESSATIGDSEKFGTTLTFAKGATRRISLGWNGSHWKLAEYPFQEWEDDESDEAPPPPPKQPAKKAAPKKAGVKR